MGKSSTPANQTVTNVTKLPAWVEQGGQDLFNQTQAAAKNMPGPYGGNLIPTPSADTNAGINMARDSAGLALPGMAQAAGAAANTASYNPGMVQAGTFLNGNIGSYMNPMLDAIEAPALQKLEMQRQLSQNQTGDQALSKNAFGGSRQGVMEGVTNANSAMAAGQLSAQIRSDAFNQAAALQGTDQNRMMQGALANQNAGLQGAATNLQGALGLSNISQGIQQAGIQGANALTGVGAQQDAYNASIAQQQAQQYEQARNAPYDAISKQLQAIGMIPYGQSSTSTGPATQQGSNMGMQALGGGLMGLQAAGMMGMTGGSMGALGGLGALLPLLSDEREKTNIQPMGKDPQSGLPLYAYDYKADVAAAKKSGKPMGPKRVGPMAQDIEKAGGPVGEVGGKKVIGLNFLSGKRQ